MSAISRATRAEIEAFRERMGWRIPWVSSFGSDFNYDFQVSFKKEEVAKGTAYHNYKMQEVENEEMSGLSVFYKNMSGDVFHTYSTYGRGRNLVSAYVCLDLTPKGRNENSGPSFTLGDWVRHHDRRPQMISISRNRSQGSALPNHGGGGIACILPIFEIITASFGQSCRYLPTHGECRSIAGAVRKAMRKRRVYC